MSDKTVKYSFDHYWADREFLITLAAMHLSEDIVVKLMNAKDPESFNKAYRKNIESFHYFGYDDPIYSDFSIVSDFDPVYDVAKVITLRDEKGNGTQGYIKGDGTFLLEPIYYFVYNFQDGYGIANNKDNNEYLVISHDGKIVKIDCIDLENFINDIAIYSIKGYLCGLVNKEGKILVPAKYNYLHYLGSGLYAAYPKGKKYDNNCILINSDGRVLCDEMFHKIEPVKDGILTVKLPRKDGDENLMGYLNEDGTWFLKPQFFEACSFKNGIAGARRCDKDGTHYYQIHLTGEITYIGHFTKTQPYRKITVIIK